MKISRELLPDQSCPSGFFGLLCNYPCHCKDSADCNRNGSCVNGCHEAWAGDDCSIALPYSSKPPIPLNQTATTILIACSWDPLRDFGTGTITGCKLWYNMSSTTTFTAVDIIDNGVYIIDNLTLHTTVEFYVQYSRLVGGVETDGPPSEHGLAETICTKPLEDPEIELETVDGNDIILILKPVSNAPERIQCDDILRYQVRYQSKDGNEQDILNTTDGLQTEVKISELSPGCVFYHVDSRVVNNAEITGDWGTPISVQSAPSAPSITKDSVLEGTFLLMKWNASTCNSTQNNLSYHYQLSGGVLQGSTTKTEVLIDDGIVPCTQYTFSVFASYMNVSSITDIMEFMSGVDCKIFFIIRIDLKTITVILSVLLLFKRFTRTFILNEMKHVNPRNSTGLDDCPLPKWSPPECEIDCPVCYNGGVCDDKTGLCICPAGFKGEYCQTSCGSNNWGRNCDVVCSIGDDEGCKGKLFCPPDPFGCTCIDGYGGNDCNTACANNHYGADCRQVCHCDSGGCDGKTGDCTSGSSCTNNYMGPACQELLPGLSCPSGFFGVLCNYPCHCKDSADCNRNGSCDNGCHKAWAGEDCSIALPYSSKPPTPSNQTATTIHIPCSWDPLRDFGTGTITGCKLWYDTSSTSTFTSVDIIANGVYIIDNLALHTTVEFYVQYSRLVGGVETYGPPSEHGSAETICSKPLESPEIELKKVDGNDIILMLKPVSNAPEQIHCDDILRYQVRYQNKDGSKQVIVNTTDGLQLEVKMSGLSPGCVFYQVDSRVVNNAEITGDWGKPISIQSAPSAPSVTRDSVLERMFLLMKWNASACNSTQNNLSYHYQLSGGIHQGSTTKTEVLIDDGIVPCTQYTFSVSASYMNVSSTTNIMEVMSGIDYPGKPTISSLTSTSLSITLELTLSDDNPCTILGYNVLVYSDIQNLEFNMDTTATSLTINENIMPNANYTVQVAARTQKGFGNFSDVGYVSTNADNPVKGTQFTRCFCVFG
ncbi:uncharacterized protein LOC117119269 [Anneissia japonica]|uniref:uncharacterized protein LOC117119269 n=1 Tax=Anneissia japonica TaxID=1529436 RepID=UPI00142556D7|nr:uncharacterized protein LOC117119269 [Anneissia japonica]